jgi:hypothetical protein
MRSPSLVSLDSYIWAEGLTGATLCIGKQHDRQPIQSAMPSTTPCACACLNTGILGLAISHTLDSGAGGCTLVGTIAKTLKVDGLVRFIC